MSILMFGSCLWGWRLAETEHPRGLKLTCHHGSQDQRFCSKCADKSGV